MENNTNEYITNKIKRESLFDDYMIHDTMIPIN